jgi:hypothetical protein
MMLVVFSVTRYFDGTAELDVSANPAAMRFLYAFEVALQSGDPKHHLKYAQALMGS